MRYIILAMLLLGACGDRSGFFERGLHSDDPHTRLKTFFWMTRADMVQHLDRLIEMAEGDPDDEVRREVLRQIGYTRDPRVLPVLEARMHSDPWEVAQSLGFYGGEEGCSRQLDGYLEVGEPFQATMSRVTPWCVVYVPQWRDRDPEQVDHLLRMVVHNHRSAARLPNWTTR